MWSLFPFISRDIAVWVPARHTDASHAGGKEKRDQEKLKKLLLKNSTKILMKEPYLFDSFTNPKDGRTSYAFRLIFQSSDRTLTDAEINKIMEKINKKIKESKDWEVR